ncbi:type III secretion system chaperone [Bremerella sp. JC770]|uniref:type III secretion system chaperone n=1 Tax=Bremerella sp. JC770 TaxID=3232137 RepID=UPI0034597B83
MIDVYEQLVQQLGDKCGIPEMKPDDNRAVHLTFDESIHVCIQQTGNEDEILLYCVIGVIESLESAEIPMQLLTASLFGQETNGATFAVEPLTGQVILQRMERLPGLTFADFEECLKQFVDAAEVWMRRLVPDSEQSGPELTPVDVDAMPEGQAISI